MTKVFFFFCKLAIHLKCLGFFRNKKTNSSYIDCSLGGTKMALLWQCDCLCKFCVCVLRFVLYLVVITYRDTFRLIGTLFAVGMNGMTIEMTTFTTIG